MDEFYTDDSEEVNIDKLNKEIVKKLFDDRQFNFKDENNLTEEEYKINENKFLQPDLNININNFETEEEYIPKKTDPYKRILELKNKLIKNKYLIDNIINKYNDTSIIKNNINYSELLSNLNSNKKKLDAFINYDLFNKRNDSDEEEEEEEEKKENKNNNTEKYYSIYDKYDRLSDNLLSKIKDIENNILNDKNKEIEYKIECNPSNNLNSLSKKLNELEILISNLEKKVGNWDLYKNRETISMEVNNLLNLMKSKNKYDTKTYSIFKQFGDKLKEFNNTNNQKITYAKTYMKLKEINDVFEIQQNYKELIKYLKLRLSATREAYYGCNQFNNIMNDINDLLLKNSENFEQLSNKYNSTLDSFKEFEKILKGIDELDRKMKKKFNV
jgi:hypothetical protein